MSNEKEKKLKTVNDTVYQVNKSDLINLFGLSYRNYRRLHKYYLTDEFIKKYLKISKSEYNKIKLFTTEQTTIIKNHFKEKFKTIS